VALERGEHGELVADDAVLAGSLVDDRQMAGEDHQAGKLALLQLGDVLRLGSDLSLQLGHATGVACGFHLGLVLDVALGALEGVPLVVADELGDRPGVRRRACRVPLGRVP
jgi:hypothetical protein